MYDMQNMFSLIRSKMFVYLRFINIDIVIWYSSLQGKKVEELEEGTTSRTEARTGRSEEEGVRKRKMAGRI